LRRRVEDRGVGGFGGAATRRRGAALAASAAQQLDGAARRGFASRRVCASRPAPAGGKDGDHD